jgi:DNA-directed RNA polymerase sigma subunit (sigma70/sigma32)
MCPVARSDLDRVTRATEALEEARAALREAMKRAKDSGETFEDIGKAAGVTRQRAWQIVNEAREPRHPL